MKLTIEQANALMATEPFIVVNVWCERTIHDGDPEDYDDSFDVGIAATNINSEHCMDELLKQLKKEPANHIDDIEPGYSVYLCHMEFTDSGPQAWYSHNDFLGMRESDPFWEVVSYERMSFVSQEEALKTEGN